MLIPECLYAAEKGKAVIVDGLGWRFAILGVLNAAYTYVWGRNREAPLVSSCHARASLTLARSPRRLHRRIHPLAPRLGRRVAVLLHRQDAAQGRDARAGAVRASAVLAVAWL